MPNYEDIKTKAVKLVEGHHDEVFNPNYIPTEILKTIADRFTSHKKTNIDSISSIKRYVQYMIAAKMVGDIATYNKLNESINGVLDRYCEEIEIVDNCGDDYSRAVDRHLARADIDVYNYMKKNHIYFVDAGLIRYGTNIYIPELDIMINLKENNPIQTVMKKCKNIVSTEDNNKYDLEEVNTNEFYVFDGHLYVDTERKQPVAIHDNVLVSEYLIDDSINYTDIKESMFRGYIKKEYIRTSKPTSLEKIRNGSKVEIYAGIKYKDNVNDNYLIVGDFDIAKYNRYPDLNHTHFVYLNKDKIVKMCIGNLSKIEELTIEDFTRATGDIIADNLLYMYRGNTSIGKMNYSGTVSFADIKVFLDNYLQ